MELQNDVGVIEKTRTDYVNVDPELYKVVMLNDNFTSMDFVIAVLQNIFDKNDEEAENIMMQVHQEGKGIAGVYVEDIAITKANMTIDFAKQNNFNAFKVLVEKE
jgi:ATP-dependent Clp protease adaptor protein ClpS